MNVDLKAFELVLTQIEARAPLAIERTTKARRVQLRMTSSLMLQLAVIKVAEGGTSSEFCEAAIAQAAARRIRDLRRKYSADTWETIVRIAHENQCGRK